MASAAEQQTTLEFYQAMADFKNMFPQMDDDVIEVSDFFHNGKSEFEKLQNSIWLWLYIH